jgi:hypothetical protein
MGITEELKFILECRFSVWNEKQTRKKRYRRIKNDFLNKGIKRNILKMR